jgi:multiple sugar transport system permease protein
MTTTTDVSVAVSGNPLARRLGDTFKLFAAGLLVVILIFPLYWMLQTSLLPTSMVLSRNPSILPVPDQVSFEAYAILLGRTPLPQWFGNSLLVTLGSSALGAATATLAGYSLSRYRSFLSNGIAYALLLGRVLPGTLLALPFFIIFRSAGLLDSTVGVILANCSMIVPFATFMMKSYFDVIPKELDDAATIDGCSPVQVLWHVLLPLVKPGIGATLALAATASWVDLLFARTLLLSSELWTVPVGIASLIGDVQVSWNQLMAAGVMSVIPVFVIYWFIQPLLVSGLTAGAVKG